MFYFTHLNTNKEVVAKSTLVEFILSAFNLVCFQCFQFEFHLGKRRVRNTPGAYYCFIFWKIEYRLEMTLKIRKKSNVRFDIFQQKTVGRRRNKRIEHIVQTVRTRPRATDGRLPTNLSR